MPFRAILFDVGETLWHAPSPPPPREFRRLAAERAAPVLARLGIGGADVDPVTRAAWDAIDPAMRKARRGDLREPDYIVAVQTALKAIGVDPGRDAAEELLEAIYISGAEAGKVAYPGAREVLDTLKERGFLLATATNRAFGGERFRCDLAHCGLDIGWDAHAVSIEVGYLKPHRAVFEHALCELRVAPEQALMVGNSLAEDVAGAQRLGIAAAWKRSRPDADGVTPQYTFDDLAELLRLPALEAASD